MYFGPNPLYLYLFVGLISKASRPTY